MRLESAALNAIAETRRALTRLEFAAMEITDSRDESTLTKHVIAIQRKAESAARAFKSN